MHTVYPAVFALCILSPVAIVSVYKTVRSTDINTFEILIEQRALRATANRGMHGWCCAENSKTVTASPVATFQAARHQATSWRSDHAVGTLFERYGL